MADREDFNYVFLDEGYIYILRCPGVPKSQEGEYIKDFLRTHPHAAKAIDHKGDSQGRCVWDSCTEDLKDLSHKFAGIEFVLQVLGPSLYYLWRTYALSGELQFRRGTVVFGEVTNDGYGPAWLR